jgi:hypothetical protein
LRRPALVVDDATDMSSSTLLFLGVRILHVLLAAAWLGTVGFVYLFLAPALDEAGPAAATVMVTISRRGFDAFIAIIGGTTVLTGLWLYWRFTGGFDPAASATMGARVFGAGGAAGILAAILGGAILGRTSKKLTALAAKVVATTDAAQRAGLIAEIAAAKQRMSLWGKVVFALQVVALACMAVGHYV